jgi:hypothetical protein
VSLKYDEHFVLLCLYYIYLVAFRKFPPAPVTGTDPSLAPTLIDSILALAEDLRDSSPQLSPLDPVLFHNDDCWPFLMINWRVYSILSSGSTYETVRQAAKDCIEALQRRLNSHTQIDAGDARRKTLMLLPLCINFVALEMCGKGDADKARYLCQKFLTSIVPVNNNSLSPPQLLAASWISEFWELYAGLEEKAGQRQDAALILTKAYQRFQTMLPSAPQSSLTTTMDYKCDEASDNNGGTPYHWNVWSIVNSYCRLLLRSPTDVQQNFHHPHSLHAAPSCDTCTACLHTLCASVIPYLQVRT